MKHVHTSSFILALLLSFSLCACGSAHPAEEKKQIDHEAADTTEVQSHDDAAFTADEKKPIEETEELQSGSSFSDAALKMMNSINEETAERMGVCGPDSTWYYKNNVLVVKGTGPMTDNHIPDGALGFDEVERPYQEIIDKVHWVIIENGITHISNLAFGSMHMLSKVFLPESVGDIGMYAFAECNNLQNVDLPESIKSIGLGAFAYCQLNNVALPEGLQVINAYAFYETPLSEITIPSSVLMLGTMGLDNNTTVTFLGDAPHIIGDEMLTADDLFEVGGGTVIYYGDGFEWSVEHCPEINWIKK